MFTELSGAVDQLTIINPVLKRILRGQDLQQYLNLQTEGSELTVVHDTFASLVRNLQSQLERIPGALRPGDLDWDLYLVPALQISGFLARQGFQNLIKDEENQSNDHYLVAPGIMSLLQQEISEETFRSIAAETETKCRNKVEVFNKSVQAITDSINRTQEEIAFAAPVKNFDIQQEIQHNFPDKNPITLNDQETRTKGLKARLDGNFTTAKNALVAAKKIQALWQSLKDKKATTYAGFLKDTLGAHEAFNIEQYCVKCTASMSDEDQSHDLWKEVSAPVLAQVKSQSPSLVEDRLLGDIALRMFVARLSMMALLLLLVVGKPDNNKDSVIAPSSVNMHYNSDDYHKSAVQIVTAAEAEQYPEDSVITDRLQKPVSDIIKGFVSRSGKVALSSDATQDYAAVMKDDAIKQQIHDILRNNGFNTHSFDLLLNLRNGNWLMVVTDNGGQKISVPLNIYE